MNKNDFCTSLKQKGIDPEIVSFDDSLSDGYNVRKNHFRFEVFVRERGTEYDCVGFSSESDALQYLFDELIKTYSQP